jgi:hypothetical protein
MRHQQRHASCWRHTRPPPSRPTPPRRRCRRALRPRPHPHTARSAVHGHTHGARCRRGRCRRRAGARGHIVHGVCRRAVRLQAAAPAAPPAGRRRRADRHEVLRHLPLRRCVRGRFRCRGRFLRVARRDGGATAAPRWRRACVRACARACVRV